MKRKASAVWRGGLKEGKGSISTESGVLAQTQYSFSTRFESGVGTNPEELIAAAHAGCFAMAFSAELGKAGIIPESISATATVTLDKTEAGWTVTSSHLDVTAKIPGADDKSSRGGKRGQARLPDFAPAQGERHDGRNTGGLNIRRAARQRPRPPAASCWIAPPFPKLRGWLRWHGCQPFRHSGAHRCRHNQTMPPPIFNLHYNVP